MLIRTAKYNSPAAITSKTVQTSRNTSATTAATGPPNTCCRTTSRAPNPPGDTSTTNPMT